MGASGAWGHGRAAGDDRRGGSVPERQQSTRSLTPRFPEERRRRRTTFGNHPLSTMVFNHRPVGGSRRRDETRVRSPPRAYHRGRDACRGTFRVHGRDTRRWTEKIRPRDRDRSPSRKSRRPPRSTTSRQLCDFLSPVTCCRILNSWALRAPAAGLGRNPPACRRATTPPDRGR